MSNLVGTNKNISTHELALIQNDLSKLNPQDRLSLYNKTCESLGLNPLTQPFGYIEFRGGKLSLYAKKDATDQLRKIHGVSVEIVSKETIGDNFVVMAKATDADNRCDEDMGSVSIKGLNGEALGNAMMKAITKAKRRVTLSICGLGILDETEVETIRDASIKEIKPTQQVTAPKKEESFIEDPLFTQEEIAETNAATKAKALPNKALGDYVMKGGKYAGTKLSDIKITELYRYVTDCLKYAKDSKKELPADVQENIFYIKGYSGLE